MKQTEIVSIRRLSTAMFAVFALGTSTAAMADLAPVDLGAAGMFAIHSKSGVTDVYASAVTGNVGSSPITGAAILVTCTEVSGTIVSVDAAGPAPFLTSAVLDMEIAYLDAGGRTLPDFTELGGGEIGGLPLSPGLYKWSTGVLISADVTFTGGPNDVFILQIAGTLIQANAARVTLAGGARAKNIFWHVAIGTTAYFGGIVLGKSEIAVKTGVGAEAVAGANGGHSTDGRDHAAHSMRPSDTRWAGPRRIDNFLRRL